MQARLRSVEHTRTDLPAHRCFITLEVSGDEAERLILGNTYHLTEEAKTIPPVIEARERLRAVLDLLSP